MVQELIIRKPDDMHAHIRDGDMMRAVLPYTTRHFRRAIIMPNLVPAVNTTERMLTYRARILSALGDITAFTPLMTLYLTEDLSVEEIEKAHSTELLTAIKFYPRGATTNSAEGVRSFDNVTAQLEAMEFLGIPLLLHGEDNVNEKNEVIDPFDKERSFVENTLPRLRKRHPNLRMVLEHITTKEAAQYVESYGGTYLATTVTPHHLICDRRALFDGGLNPHFFCLPVLKRTEDVEALRKLVTGDYAEVFAGTDTAPHPTHAKERACGCAGGCFVAPVALSMYAQVFEEENALDSFEKFVSTNGADWYGLPVNKERIKLVRYDEPDGPRALLASAPLKEQSDAEAELEFLRTAVRPFGMHTDPAKTLKWHWRVA